MFLIVSFIAISQKQTRRSKPNAEAQRTRRNDRTQIAGQISGP
jgi:hypothetical protein